MLAVIMAGGRGTRLAPYTTILPKPLMPLHDRPIIDVILRQLVAAGMDAISISVGHLGGLIEAWVRSAGHFGIPISFVYEDRPLGTAGALKLAAPGDETFIALNGDILTTLSFPALVDAHATSGAAVTLAVNERHVDIEYGVVHSDASQRLIGFEEKPAIPYTVSMGVYAFAAGVADYIESGERIDFPDLLIRMRDANERVAVFPFDGYWRDIGNRTDYTAAVDDFSAAPERFIPDSSVGVAQRLTTTVLSPPVSIAGQRGHSRHDRREVPGLVGAARSERGRGGIVIFGSGAGLAGGPNMVAYGASKAFDMVFAEALWAELHDKGVDVLGLILGKTDTPALRALEYSRGQIHSLDEVPPGTATVDEVIAEAFENLANGPTWFAGEMMRAAEQLTSSLTRKQTVELFAQAAAAAMGPRVSPAHAR